MNLLVLSNTNDSFNSVRPEAEIYISLSKASYNITIMTQKQSQYYSRFIEHGIDLIDTNFTKKIDIKLIKQMKNLIKEKQIDIIYATNSRAISNAIFASLGTKVKLVSYRGTTGGLYRTDPSSYLNALNPRVNGVVCVSNAVQKHVQKQVFSSKQYIKAIYKGHKTSWYNQNKIDLNEFSTNENNFNIAFIANTRPHKGLIYVLEAAKKISELKDIHILLIGRKISQEPYVSLINNSGMKDRIHITGYRSDVPDIISACDILIHASTRKEGLPGVILEALASKIPVIASSNESSLEIIEDGINGYITPIKDAEAISQKIKHLYTSKETLKKLTDNAQNIINTKMSHENTVYNYIQFFNKLVKKQ